MKCGSTKTRSGHRHSKGHCIWDIGGNERMHITDSLGRSLHGEFTNWNAMNMSSALFAGDAREIH
jgi:hypothetical protein